MLEGLAASGGEQDLVEREALGGGTGDAEVAGVGRVEGAAEEGQAHGVIVVGG